MKKNLKEFLVPKQLLNKAHLTAPTLLWEDDNTNASTRNIPAETAISFIYNGQSLSVMMASPTDLVDFGYGFSLSEKLINDIEEIQFIDILDNDKGILISMNVSEKNFNHIIKKSRFSAGMTGCGICGVESLELLNTPHTKVSCRSQIHSTSIYHAYEELPKYQPEKKITGAVHAASWCDHDGQIVYLREDVGRHNAIDKLIGAMALNNADFSQGFCFITSRCSYEIIAKAARVGIPIVVAISAPTSLAIKLAHDTGITLIALARKNTFSIFTHEKRVIQ